MARHELGANSRSHHLRGWSSFFAVILSSPRPTLAYWPFLHAVLLRASTPTISALLRAPVPAGPSTRRERSAPSLPPEPIPSQGHALNHRRAAAVDIDRGAGDVGAGVGGEKAGDVGELLGPPDAAERHLLGARGDVVLERDPRLGRGLHMLVGLDEADQQRIDQHVVRRAFAREHLGQRQPGGARDRGRSAACARRLGADIERVDDPAPAPLLHLRPYQPRQPDGGEQLLVEVVAPDLVGDVLERAGARGPGIVHDDVDLAERRHRFVVGALDVGGDADVPRNGGDLSLRARADGLDRLVERATPARDDRDVRARGREPRGDRKADALAAAGDHGRAAGETDFHFLPSRWRRASDARLFPSLPEAMLTIAGDKILWSGGDVDTGQRRRSQPVRSGVEPYS